MQHAYCSTHIAARSARTPQCTCSPMAASLLSFTRYYVLKLVDSALLGLDVGDKRLLLAVELENLELLLRVRAVRRIFKAPLALVHTVVGVACVGTVVRRHVVVLAVSVSYDSRWRKKKKKKRRVIGRL